MVNSGQIQALPSAWVQLQSVCTPELEQVLLKIPPAIRERIEEVRFRLGQPLQVCGEGLDSFVTGDGQFTNRPEQGFIVTEAHLSRLVQVVTQSSLYAVEEELRRGYVTMSGGHRVGMAGRVILNDNGTVRSIRHITAANFRLAKERLGAADGMRRFLYDHATKLPYSVLILSPPQCGKTTMLRDCARQWSEGTIVPGHPQKVGIVDERSEIAGSVDGIAQFQVGPRTDVLDACPKAEGMLMMVRSLSPQLIVTDEIGRAADRDAVLEAAHAGVAVLASAHARNLTEWQNRPYMRELFQARSFQRYVILSRRNGPGTIDAILDEAGQPIRVFTRELNAPGSQYERRS